MSHQLIQTSKLAVLSTMFMSAIACEAHFIYVLAPEPGTNELQVVFGEGPYAAESNDMLKHLEGIELHARGSADVVQLSDGIGARIAKAYDTEVYEASRTYGVISRGDAPFLLEYYAVGGPSPELAAWQNESQLRFRVTPKPLENGTIELKAIFDNKPVSGAELTLPTGVVKTDKNGIARLRGAAPGLISVRAKWVENTTGVYEDKAYESIKHYSTLTFHLGSNVSENNAIVRCEDTSYPDLPAEVTSFGACLMGRTIYVYGGHMGSAHSYAREEQANTLWSLHLDEPNAVWQDRAKGPHLQGNALVAADGKVILIGGFTAENEVDEEHNLRSKAIARMFDPRTETWSDLPPLPEPRSSFDAIAIDQTVYVVGGWSMQGDAESVWHRSAWKLDLGSADAKWQPIADAPFQRRALALAAHDGKLYAIGGMSRDNGTVTATDVYDPATDLWTEGPKLVGRSMNGFGCAAFPTGGDLYATAFDGSIQKLAHDGSRWEVVGQMPKRRFFHRMLPASPTELLVFGGADMEVGKFPDIDRLVVTNRDVSTPHGDSTSEK